MTTRKHYVGVAGFVTSSEIMAAIETIPKNPRHSLAIGILASAKTLRGETNRYPNRYPKVSELENILRPMRDIVYAGTMPVEFHLHYAVEDLANAELELEQVGDVITERQFDGVQINVPPHWAGSEKLHDAIRTRIQRHRHTRIIVQIRPPRNGEPFTDLVEAALWATNNNTIGTHLKNDVLFDASAGRGVELNSVWASEMIHAYRATKPLTWRKDASIGVAGGLGPTKLQTVHDLMCTHGPLSFDCESGVRRHDDTMSIPVMQAYLREAWELVGSDP